MADQDNEVIDQLRHSAAGVLKFDSRHIRHWRDRIPGFDRNLWRKMAEQGWFSIMAPERDGGTGLGIAAAAVAERFGRACSPEPFVMAGLPGPLLLGSYRNRPPSSQKTTFPNVRWISIPITRRICATCQVE